ECERAGTLEDAGGGRGGVVGDGHVGEVVRAGREAIREDAAATPGRGSVTGRGVAADRAVGEDDRVGGADAPAIAGRRGVAADRAVGQVHDATCAVYIQDAAAVTG